MSFGTREMLWDLEAHITPPLGPERAGGTPHHAGRATVALLVPGHFLVMSFGMVSPLSIKMTWEFS